MQLNGGSFALLRRHALSMQMRDSRRASRSAVQPGASIVVALAHPFLVAAWRKAAKNVRSCFSGSIYFRALQISTAAHAGTIDACHRGPVSASALSSLCNSA